MDQIIVLINNKPQEIIRENGLGTVRYPVNSEEKIDYCITVAGEEKENWNITVYPELPLEIYISLNEEYV